MTSAFGRLSPFSSILLFPPFSRPRLWGRPHVSGDLCSFYPCKTPPCCSQTARSRICTHTSELPHIALLSPSIRSPSQPWLRRSGGQGGSHPPPGAAPSHLVGRCGRALLPRWGQTGKSQHRPGAWHEATPIHGHFPPPGPTRPGAPKGTEHPCPAPTSHICIPNPPLHSLSYGLHLLSCTYILPVASAAASPVVCSDSAPFTWCPASASHFPCHLSCIFTLNSLSHLCTPNPEPAGSCVLRLHPKTCIYILTSAS